MLTNLCIPGISACKGLPGPLHELGVLNRFYYSHAWRTTPASLGLPEDRAINLWMKEYLVRGHLKFIGWRLHDIAFPLYHRVWEQGVLRHWRPAPVAHVLLWGAARRVLARAKQERALTLGFVVNSHPAQFNELLGEEAERVGVPYERQLSRLQNHILEEVAQCDHLHAESNFISDSFAMSGFPREKIHVVHLGKDFSMFYPAADAERKNSDDEFRVLCVGAVSLRKGQVHLLHAWEQLKLPGASLTLIGALHPEIAPVVRRYSDRFRHIGNLPQQQLRAHLIRASVMVVPSIEDGYANVVAEALACGVPVITTVNTGAADHIRDGANGYVVPIASPRAIAEKLELLYRDRDLLRHLAAGARATIPQIGSWAERAREFAALYRRLAGQDARSLLKSA